MAISFLLQERCDKDDLREAQITSLDLCEAQIMTLLQKRRAFAKEQTEALWHKSR